MEEIVPVTARCSPTMLQDQIAEFQPVKEQCWAKRPGDAFLVGYKLQPHKARENSGGKERQQRQRPWRSGTCDKHLAID